MDSLSPFLLFGLVGIYHASLPAEYFFAFSFCLNFCVWGGLSVGWKFVVPVYCGVGGVELVVACQGFLVRGACVCVLVSGTGSLLSEVQRSIQLCVFECP